LLLEIQVFSDVTLCQWVVVPVVSKEHSVCDCLTVQDERTVFFETWDNSHLTQNLAPADLILKH